MFDVDAFLAGPLTARVATAGPTVRPTWYLWENRAFWILTGPWARLAGLVRESPSIALTVDVCDVGTGRYGKFSRAAKRRCCRSTSHVDGGC